MVIILHGGSIPERMQKNPGKFLRVMKRADEIVCPSPYFMQVIKKYGLKGRHIENVLDSTTYQFVDKKEFRPTLFWMRTFEDIYNPEMAVRVAALIKKHYPNLTLIMAGHDRGALAKTKKLVESLELTGQVEFAGYVSNEKKNQLARKADIYLCTNKVDNAPVSVVEMMHLGLPVVSVNSGGLPFIIQHEHNGILVNCDDDVAMSEEIIRIIQQPSFGASMARNAKHFAGNFNEEPVFKKWEQLFYKLAKQRKPLTIIRSDHYMEGKLSA